MSSSAHDLLPHVDLGNTFGVLFIAVTISALLFGLTNVQIFIYFQTQRDTGMTPFKLIVIWLWYVYLRVTIAEHFNFALCPNLSGFLMLYTWH
ncbi:hypothetical protein CY34DRAFT_811899 [Suillus luteus UH-Slu-Lm8-n1]|uniref:Uncharacterized protein n=1 Tax=Suillus luteus UH-Slu-Lm8-n1 TaxID=930992 RepID=A0A0D0AN98_9AGAM|nr:hypothetical protein CY34DRAFT_811899 [Suillus luteus UH-Slu-Lm8-n1]